jgi:hypothetical protein
VTAPTPYAPIASADTLTSGGLAYIVRGSSPAALDALMVRASRTVENRCQRRFSPFVNLVESHVAEGVTFDGGWGGSPGADALGFFTGALAMRGGRGMGQENVTEFWVDQVAPHRPELWQYTALSVSIIRPYSAALVLGAQVIGPQPDTGHVRFPTGTYCPPGSTIIVTYSGGYTLGFPEDLVQATRLTAAKTLILEIEPQNRPGLDTADLDAEITDLLAPYAR